MNRFDEEDTPLEPYRIPDNDPFSFDPLMDPWPATESRAVAPDGDPLFVLHPAPPSDEDKIDFTRYGERFPDRYDTGYRDRLTELQRRLRQETVTIPTEEGRWAVTVRELVETLLLAALIFLAVRASFQNFRVEGASMQPSLEDGEYLIVNKLSYAELDLGALDWLPFFESGDNPVRNLWDDPDRGDVIVFRAPTSPDRDFIKRVIGLPGDTVEISGSTQEVFVNGQKIDEPYIQGTTSCGAGECTFVVPEAGSPEAQAECASEECYFVMGDNRQNSSDSRQGWLVPKENIIGKTLITYWHDGGPNVSLAPNHSVGSAEEAD